MVTEVNEMTAPEPGYLTYLSLLVDENVSIKTRGERFGYSK